VIGPRGMKGNREGWEGEHRIVPMVQVKFGPGRFPHIVYYVVLSCFCDPHIDILVASPYPLIDFHNNKTKENLGPTRERKYYYERGIYGYYRTSP